MCFMTTFLLTLFYNSLLLTLVSSFEFQIYDRDGLTLGEFMKGDMYIRDLKNTKGHICGLTCGEWHPRTKETVLTSSEDGSLRIWDVNNFLSQTQVLFTCPIFTFTVSDLQSFSNENRGLILACKWYHLTVYWNRLLSRSLLDQGGFQLQPVLGTVTESVSPVA